MTLLIIVIVLALVFDYINGFHDAANSIATVVSTKVLSPFKAVLWAAFFNAVVLFLCQHKFLGFEFKVADTVAKIVKTEAITMTVILAGLLSAIFWNLLTWWKGIPSSSSHTLLGGFAGAAVAKAGFGVLADVGKIYITLGFIFLAPLIGMILAYILTVIIMNVCKKANPSRADNWFKRLQLVSSAAFSLGHGANDAQKVMGIIAAAMLVFANTASKDDYAKHTWTHVKTAYKIDTAYYALDSTKLSADTIDGKAMFMAEKSNFEKKGKAKDKNYIGVKGSELATIMREGKEFCIAPQASFVEISKLKPKKDIADIPYWVQYACFLAIGLGTLSGGWRIIKTMGTRITKVTPLEGVAAETAGSITLYLTQFFGIPVSTTHTITGSIVGVGVAKRVSAVRWGVTRSLLVAWILTIPVSGTIAALMYWLLNAVL
ncbi:MAG: inorganic phosphate transporter [Bacteroidetes bacterium]|nr:inorganic phosphate transporter [Bacteroidota bacterium]